MTANCDGCLLTRRSSPSAARTFLRLALTTLLLFGALASTAFAQSCDFVPIGATAQTGAAGSSVGFILQGQTACAATITGTLSVTSDTTGGATVGPTPFTATLDTDFNFVVNLGSLPGGTGTVTAVCTSGGCTGSQIAYTFNTANNYAYVPTTPTTIVSNVLSSFQIGTNLLRNGVPGTFATDFTNVTLGSPIASVTPNGAGTAAQTVGFTSAGARVLRGTIACPVLFADPACNSTAPVDYNVTVEAVGVTRVSPAAQPATAGVPLTLTARLGGATTTAPDGQSLIWGVTQPLGGDGAMTGTTTTVGGNSSSTFTATVPGTYTVSALTTCTFCGPTSTTFTVTIAAVVRTLSVTSGNAQTAPINTTLPAPLVATAQDNAVNAPGITINWTVTGGATLSAPTSVTNGAGQASINVTLGATPGAVTVTGTRADDGTAVAVFTATGTLVRTLTVVSGNGQTAPVSAPLPAPLVALAQDNGVNAPGITINWVATGGATLSAPTSVTNGTGQASINVTLGPVAGPVTVTGTRADDGTAVALFTVNGTLVRTLGIVSGNGQSAPTSTALPAPLVVLAQDNGVNAPGITINWTATGGATLSAPTSVTAGSGQTAINVTLGAVPGAVTVTGTRADDGTAIATFTVNGTLTRTLTIVSGNNQTGAPGSSLPSPLSVEARNNGTVIGGTGINYTIITGSGTLAPAATTTNPAGIANSTLTLGAAAGTVVVRVARQDDLTVFVDFTMSAGKLGQLPGLTQSGYAVAVAIDKFCPGLGTVPSNDPNVNDLRLRCNELISAIGTDPAGVRAALEELFADVALVQSSSGLLAAQTQFDNIKARIAALRSGTRGISFGGLALNNGRNSAPVGTLFDSLLAEGTSKEAGTEFQRWGFFAAGTIGRGDAERGIINPAYDFDIKGLTAGVDYRHSDKWIFGGTLGYTRQNNSLTDAEGTLNTHGWSISGYTTYYQSNSWYSDAVLSYGSNSYEMERRLKYSFSLPGSLTTSVDQRSSADSNGTSLSFAGSFGRDFNHGAWGFGPYARFMYTKLNFDATTERMLPGSPGSGLALVIQTRDVTSVSSVLGGKLTYVHSTNWGVLIPHLQAEWQHEFKDDPSQVEAHFLYDPSATPFTITGDKLDTDFFRIGLGLSMVLTKGRSGFFYYEKMIGRDGISQDNLALGLRIEF